MTIDPKTADVTALAEALRTYCNKAINCDAFMDPPGVVPVFAAALLGVVEECEKEDVTLAQHATRGTVLRAAALAAVNAGLVLTVEGEG